jgi:hypothetical protein
MQAFGRNQGLYEPGPGGGGLRPGVGPSQLLEMVK